LQQRQAAGSISPLEKHSKWLPALVAEQPDLTLSEIVAAMRRRQITGSAAQYSGSRSSWHQLQKSLRAAEQERAELTHARRRWMRERGIFDPAHLVFIDETSTTTKIVRLRGGYPRGVRLIGRLRMGMGK
jgi:hypothetical protein